MAQFIEVTDSLPINPFNRQTSALEAQSRDTSMYVVPLTLDWTLDMEENHSYRLGILM